MKIQHLMLSFKLMLLSLPLLAPAAIAAPLLPGKLLKIPPTAPAFSCGSDLTTYRVISRSNGSFGGIRCVKFTEGMIDSTPRFVWYGEGKWNGKTYRHLGQAVRNPSNPKQRIGYASDMTGNGEQANGNFNGNLTIEFVNAHTIQVTGAWNETWQKVSTVAYKPLPQPQTCGPNFDKYSVSDTRGDRTGGGQRCMLRLGLEQTTWFGFGNWNGTPYSHLGVLSASGFGASDLCRSGAFCNQFPYGSLELNPQPDGYEVSGRWAEHWSAWSEFPNGAQP